MAPNEYLNICFLGEIRKISVLFGLKSPNLELGSHCKRLRQFAKGSPVLVMVFRRKLYRTLCNRSKCCSLAVLLEHEDIHSVSGLAVALCIGLESEFL